MNLIFDRTAEDVQAAREQRGTVTTPLKGCYNATDLNRVEAAVKAIAAELNSAGYAVEITPVLKGSSRVPSGYTELEYIQSNGTEYIDTGIAPAPGMEAELIFSCEPAGTIENALFGSSWSLNGFFLMTYSGVNGIRWHSCGGSTDVTVPDLMARHTVLCKKGSIRLDDGAPQTFATTGDDSADNIRLFGVTNTGGYGGARNGIYKCYAYAIKDGEDMRRNFIPCKNPEGTVGLYDLVGGNFYGNAGTGIFAAGPEINPYENREWRESDVIRRAQWAQYIANVWTLRDAIAVRATTPELPAADAKLDYIGANNIEKILADLDELLGWMTYSRKYCGTFAAGQTILPRKG